jgi:hypothetical protein
MLTKRGRPCRAGVRATRCVEVTLTPVEYSAVARLARANGLSLADTMRLGTLHLAAALEEGGAPPVILGGVVAIVAEPIVDPRELFPVELGDDVVD